MSDIKQELRENADLDEMEGCNPQVVALERRAADHIESLEARNRELEARIAELTQGEPVAWSGRTIRLKTDSLVFDDVVNGWKNFELRFNDRDFWIGDDLVLCETQYTGAEMKAGAPLVYSGREITKRVGYILRGPIYGLADGWVIASFARPGSSN